MPISGTYRDVVRLHKWQVPKHQLLRVGQSLLQSAQFNGQEMGWGAETLYRTLYGFAKATEFFCAQLNARDVNSVLDDGVKLDPLSMVVLGMLQER